MPSQAMPPISTQTTGLEPRQTHKGSQSAATQRRNANEQNRKPADRHQGNAITRQGILQGTKCSLYYRLLSNSRYAAPRGSILAQSKPLATKSAQRMLRSPDLDLRTGCHPGRRSREQFTASYGGCREAGAYDDLHQDFLGYTAESWR